MAGADIWHQDGQRAHHLFGPGGLPLHSHATYAFIINICIHHERRFTWLAVAATALLLSPLTPHLVRVSRSSAPQTVCARSATRRRRSCSSYTWTSSLVPSPSLSLNGSRCALSISFDSFRWPNLCSLTPSIDGSPCLLSLQWPPTTFSPMRFRQFDILPRTVYCCFGKKPKTTRAQTQPTPTKPVASAKTGDVEAAVPGPKLDTAAQLSNDPAQSPPPSPPTEDQPEPMSYEQWNKAASRKERSAISTKAAKAPVRVADEEAASEESEDPLEGRSPEQIKMEYQKWMKSKVRSRLSIPPSLCAHLPAVACALASRSSDIGRFLRSCTLTMNNIQSASPRPTAIQYFRNGPPR